MATANNKPLRSESILEKRIKNFKKIKRGYYSLWIISILYFLSFLNPILVNNKALMVKYNGTTSFPAFSELFMTGKEYTGEQFGQSGGVVNYRQLKKDFKAAGEGNWVLMPPYPYGPLEVLMSEFPEGVSPPTAPDRKNLLGTDTQGRDIFARLSYGFRISISFSLVVTFFGLIIGITVGAILGFYGGRVDLVGLRLIEVFSTLPFLFIMMILVKFVNITDTWSAFLFLASLMVVLTGWIGISYYVRGEFYREKSRDYVAAARALGQSDFNIMLRHILPNALTSVITFTPFRIVGYISSLVALDFLGFGLPVPTPSWGELIRQGSSNISYPWLILTPLFMLFMTLSMVTFIGEAVRQAFDPRDHTRLR